MFSSIFQDIKHKLADRDPIWFLIIACVSVFILEKTLLLIGLSLGNETISNSVKNSFALPLHFSEFVSKPWSIFTYAFLHADFFHLLLNMIMLYWFGEIYNLYLGRKYLANILVGGALIGGFVALLAFQFVPFLKNPLALLIGASAAVEAVVFAATALNPEHEIRLLIIGRVQLKYIAFFSLVLNFVSIAGSNSGGVIAHLGGALWGFVYIKQLQNGLDLMGFIPKLKALFKPKSKLKVIHSQSITQKQDVTDKNSKKLDEILDKINESGYESLAKEDKDFLFKYSNDTK